jgi:DNA repair exonuclease SbcCD ATPase subunit
LLQQHSQARYMLSLLESRKELEVLQVELMTMTTKQANLNKLKSIITDVTNSALQDLVDNINTITNSILEELFDCGISIELKLYKEIKNKTKTKPYVNIIVIKDGEDFDIGALSGGERDRVSLALTVGLSSLHISPIVFIDEGLSALDEDRKHDCLEIMRKYLIPQKTVVHIEHAGTDGHFDEVITLGCC